MPKDQNVKPYDLEERTFLFAKKGIAYFRSLPKNISNIEKSKK